MIRFAKEEDVRNIMHFIDKYWSKGHILSVNNELFFFQHKYGDEISFVLSTNEDDEINGLLGYIPYGSEERDIMLALWKALPSDTPMLGVRMLQFIMRNVNARIIAAVGINPQTTIKLYKFLGYKTGKMSHWYRLNPYVQYRIASIADKFVPVADVEQGVYNLEHYADFNQLEEKFDFNYYVKEISKPYKERRYIKRRYFEHPIFKYSIYGAAKAGKKSELLIVLREQPYNGSVALRLVDCIGNYSLLPYITSDIDAILITNHAEYIDIYETGLPDVLLSHGGWRNVSETSNIIPDYFAPYECRNIDIYYSTTDKDVVLFKGDGDQDRPN